MKLTKQTLDMLYSYYKSITEQDQEEYRKRLKTITYSVSSFNYRIFSYIIDLMQLNDFPQVIPDAKYKYISKPELYRGTKSMEHSANLLADFDYHKGDGVDLRGIYATNQKSRAKYYCTNVYDSSPETIMKLKLARDTNKVDYEDMRQICLFLRDHAKNKFASIRDLFAGPAIKKPSPKLASEKEKEQYQNIQLLKCFMKKLARNGDTDLLDALTDTLSPIAALLGVDVIKLDAENLAILNRGKIVVSESEFKRITANSTIYKDGRIDFDAKREEDYLLE